MANTCRTCVHDVPILNRETRKDGEVPGFCGRTGDALIEIVHWRNDPAFPERGGQNLYGAKPVEGDQCPGWEASPSGCP